MKRFCKINLILTGLLIVAGICFGTSITARAGSNLSGDGTGQGGSGGNNTYTFYYNYDSGQDAIVLTVKTKKATNTFGGAKEHTFTKGDAMKGYIKILQEDSREASTVYLNSIDDVVIVEEKMTGHEKRIR